MKQVTLAFLALFLAPAAQAAYPFTMEEAIARFSVDQAAQCDFETDYEGAAARRIEASYVTVVNEGERETQIFSIWCSQGAYNLNSVFYVADQFGGIQAVQFAEPVLNEKQKIVGFSTTNWLTNAGFDAKKNELSFFAKGRGLGDCYVAGTYKFLEGQFLLKRYEVDSKCDGKQNPKKIIDLK